MFIFNTHFVWAGSVRSVLLQWAGLKGLISYKQLRHIEYSIVLYKKEGNNGLNIVHRCTAPLGAPRRSAPMHNIWAVMAVRPLWPMHCLRVPTTRAFRFAIRINSIQITNQFESIRFVKKLAFRFTITGFCIMNNVFQCL